MLNLGILVWLTIAAAAIAFWWKSDASKNHALRHGKNYCKKMSLQFLDDSLVLRKLSLFRHTSQWPKLVRTYSFEFTSTGEQRYSGEITVVGTRVLEVHLEPHYLP